MENLKYKKARAAVPWLLLLIWLSVIFLFSAQGGGASNSISGRVVDTILRAVDRQDSMSLYNTVNTIVRKGAHFTEYAILAVLWAKCFSGIKKIGKHSLWLAFAASVISASFDEFHQSFVSGRTPLVTDVLIDSSGALLGIIVFAAVRHLLLRKKADKSKKGDNAVSRR